MMADGPLIGGSNTRDGFFWYCRLLPMIAICS